MTNQPTTSDVWDAIKEEPFAVLGMVTARNECRTVGIIYEVDNQKLYIGTDKDAWKVRHIQGNPHVSITIPIAKRIPLVPWVKIPAATITFSGTAKVLMKDEVSDDLVKRVFSYVSHNDKLMVTTCLIEVTPEKDFLTYGIGIPMIQMRDHAKARGRVPVNLAKQHEKEAVAS
ncbi:pyridoxamine 5'-phosphate oxidase family protein [Candidatus Leptofilum sp.]|uniref:pyridoxamine 5'-phosphate oxidase family protein n=1 Tax=Candidatus Leptofilum sp. TaxID=3241576 RepID=UPI003B5BE056